MFTGIIESVGSVRSMTERGGDARIQLDVGKLDMSDVAVGDSIAVHGVCLTVIEFDQESFLADVSNETLSKTVLGNISIGYRVNLEKALTLNTRLGGHLVSGHVDGLGRVVARQPEARSVQFRVQSPDELSRYIAAKGSITVNGISLTVNAVEGNVFDLNIVPHTLAETTLGEISVGDSVNLEVDLMARYLERLLNPEVNPQASSLDAVFLAEHGYWRG